MILRLKNVPWRYLPDWLSGNRLRILMYHSISDNPRDPHALAPVEFVRQMNFLQDKKVVSLIEGLRAAPGEPITEKYLGYHFR